MYLQEIEIIIEKYDCIEWNNSRGSQIEYPLNYRMGMYVFYLNDNKGNRISLYSFKTSIISKLNPDYLYLYHFVLF